MTAVATQQAKVPKTADQADVQIVGEIRRIPLAELHDSPHNPRQRYNETALLELASSFLQTGQLTPIIVRPRKAGGYEIAAGHRRFRAAKLAVQRSPDGAKYRRVDGLEAKVVDLDDATFIEVLNVENLQRDDLHPLEEAQGFKDLMTEAGYDVAKISARIGRSDRYVYDSLTLLKLIPRAKKLFLDEVFERGHAIELARLTAEQQERALGNVGEVAEGDRGDSLLLQPDTAAGQELPLHDRVKPVSVKEFQHAIQRNVRATPERVDPFLFPESVAALEAAKEEKLSVIHITREYLAGDEVRSTDEQRVFGSPAWERADGQIDPYEDEFGERTMKRSKTCAWSRYGFVASGPGQGEVFKVCINKQKCAVHWPEHVKKAQERAKREKSQAKAKAAGPDAEARELAAEARATKAREAEALRMRRVEEVLAEMVKEHAPQWAREVIAVASQIKLPAIFAGWMANGRLLEPDLDNRIRYGELDDVAHAREIFDAMRPKLGGGWSKRGYPEKAAAQPVGMALLYWLETQCGKREAALVKNAETVVKAEEATAAAAAKKAKAEKKPAPKNAKKGSH